MEPEVWILIAYSVLTATGFWALLDLHEGPLEKQRAFGYLVIAICFGYLVTPYWLWWKITGREP